MQLRNPKDRGVATRVSAWLAALENGKLVGVKDLRWLVGETRVSAYLAAVKAAKKEAAEKAKALVEINDGNVPDYLAALDRAKAATAQCLRDGDKFKSSAKIGTAKHRKAEQRWRERRAARHVLQEKVEEAWSIVDEKYHDAFHTPPEGGWGDKFAVLAEFEWPPYLLKTQLEDRPESHLVDIPRFQQRELLEDELSKLLIDPPRSAPDARSARLRERAVD